MFSTNLMSFYSIAYKTKFFGLNRIYQALWLNIVYSLLLYSWIVWRFYSVVFKYQRYRSNELTFSYFAYLLIETRNRCIDNSFSLYRNSCTLQVMNFQEIMRDWFGWFDSCILLPFPMVKNTQTHPAVAIQLLTFLKRSDINKIFKKLLIIVTNL